MMYISHKKNTFDIQISKIPFSHVYVVLSKWFFMIPYLDIRSVDEDHNKLIVLAQFKDGSKHFLEDYPEFKTIAGLC